MVLLIHTSFISDVNIYCWLVSKFPLIWLYCGYCKKLNIFPTPPICFCFLLFAEANSPGWPITCHEEEFIYFCLLCETVYCRLATGCPLLPIFLSLPADCWDYRHGGFVCVTRVAAHGFVPDSQAVDQLSCISLAPNTLFLGSLTHDFVTSLVNAAS